MIITPSIFTTGIFEVKEPFQVSEGVEYVVTEVRSFEELLRLGIDIFNDVYAPLGLSNDDFVEDRVKLASLVTLSGNGSPTLFIPDTYITSMPNSTSVPYNHAIISVSLGAVPDTLLLENLKTNIGELVLGELGITPMVKEHVANLNPTYVTNRDHQVAENQRKARLENNTSLYNQNSAKDIEIAKLQRKIADLEEFISVNL